MEKKTYFKLDKIEIAEIKLKEITEMRNDCIKIE